MLISKEAWWSLLERGHTVRAVLETLLEIACPTGNIIGDRLPYWKHYWRYATGVSFDILHNSSINWLSRQSYQSM